MGGRPILWRTDGDSSRIGHVSLTVDDRMHRSIHVEISPRDQPFDNGRERLTIHLTLLYHKCARQQLLERLAINGGIVTHTGECCDSAAAELGGLWRASGGTSFAASNRSLSPSECTVNRRIRCPKIRPPLQV